MQALLEPFGQTQRTLAHCHQVVLDVETSQRRLVTHQLLELCDSVHGCTVVAYVQVGQRL